MPPSMKNCGPTMKGALVEVFLLLVVGVVVVAVGRGWFIGSSESRIETNK